MNSSRYYLQVNIIVFQEGRIILDGDLGKGDFLDSPHLSGSSAELEAAQPSQKHSLERSWHAGTTPGPLVYGGRLGVHQWCQVHPGKMSAVLGWMHLEAHFLRCWGCLQGLPRLHVALLTDAALREKPLHGNHSHAPCRGGETQLLGVNVISAQF